MNRRKFSFALTVLIFSAAALYAGGTTASFLKLGSGARATGLGGAFVAVSDDIDSLSYNPAGLAGLRNNAVGFTRAELMAGLSYNFLGYSQPVTKGAFGLGVDYLSQSAIEGRGADREATGGFEASDAAYNLAYGRSVTPRTGIGFNFKYIASRIADESANGWAVDAGWRYKAAQGLSLGFAVQNLGPAMKFLDEGSALPLTARLGAGYTILNSILVAFDINRQVTEKKTVFCLGTEYALFDSLFMRAGYLKTAASGVNLTGSSGLKAGVGFKLGRFALDYALSPFGDIGKAHRISLGMVL